MVKQSRTDRLLRLSEGRCPIHGIPMVQVGVKGSLFVALCPRRDCGISGTASVSHGPVTLDQEYQEWLN